VRYKVPSRYKDSYVFAAVFAPRWEKLCLKSSFFLFFFSAPPALAEQSVINLWQSPLIYILKTCAQNFLRVNSSGICHTRYCMLVAAALGVLFMDGAAATSASVSSVTSTHAHAPLPAHEQPLSNDVLYVGNVYGHCGAV
jgi:hypothetical protein